MYWLNYLDRNAIALAKINHIQDDLNLSGTQYQTCVSILFVGYILGKTRTIVLKFLKSQKLTRDPRPDSVQHVADSCPSLLVYG
jgi:hypothetical protein